MNVLWYMCAPDGAFPWRPEGSRNLDYSYFQQLAKAYDRLGFTGALFATGAHDVWVLAAALLPETERMKFLVAIHPGLDPADVAGKNGRHLSGVLARQAVDQYRFRRCERCSAHTA